MDSLYLDIDHCVWINYDSAVFLQEVCGPKFCLVLYFRKLGKEWRIFGIIFQFSYFFEISNPFISDSFCYQWSKSRVCIQEPSALSNTVCLVVKSIWIDLRELREHVVYKKLWMQCCNTVCGVAADNGKIGHSNHLWIRFFNDGDLRNLFILHWEEWNCRREESLVDLIDNLHMTRENWLNHWKWPLLKSFRHESVVCISKSIDRNIPSFIPT